MQNGKPSFVDVREGRVTYLSPEGTSYWTIHLNIKTTTHLSFHRSCYLCACSPKTRDEAFWLWWWWRLFITGVSWKYGWQWRSRWTTSNLWTPDFPCRRVCVSLVLVLVSVLLTFSVGFLTFLHRIQLGSYASYPLLVAYPSSIQTILARLDNDYYRHLEVSVEIFFLTIWSVLIS